MNLFLVMAKKKREKRKLANRPFWTIMGILIMISFLTIILAAKENLTGNSTVQPVSFMRAGSILDLEPNIDGLKYADVNVIADVKNAVVTTEEIDKLSWNFRGVVISMFKISSTDEDKFGEVKLTLKLKEEELASKGLTKEELRVYHNYEELDTTVDKTAGGYIFFKATSPGMGEFLIGKRMMKAAAVSTDNQPTEETQELDAVEQPAATAAETLPEPTEPTTPALKEKGFFAKIADFFKSIFS